MGKIIEQKINTFTGGMANDVREKDATKYSFTKGFDTFSYKHRLVPYRSYEAGNDTLDRKINKFIYQGGKLWGRGFISSTPSVYDVQVYSKDTFTDGTWTTPANSSDATSQASFTPSDLFIYYNGFIYMQSGASTVGKFDVTSSAAFVLSDSTFAGVGTGVVHSKDNILYVSGKNSDTSPRIHINNAGTWTLNVLTLPKNFTITSMCEYGNYLAIACVSDDPLTKSSKVFLWDRDTSLTTLSESIDWGEGSLNVLEELDGRLVGISLNQRVNATNLLFNSTLSFKYYAGAQGAIEFDRIAGLTAATPISYLGTLKQKANNRIYFSAIITTPEGTATREGVWSLGKNLSGQYAITNEYQSSDGTIPSAIDGFFLMGSYIFIAYSNSGTLSGNISKSDDTATYSNSSIYESLVFDGEDSSITKKLIGVTVNTTPLPAAGQIILKYRIDENIGSDSSSWNTIFTNTTDNSLSHSSINIESTGATLPEFKEIQFRIESTGGAIPVGMSFAYEITGKRLY